jgi:PAS domain S-box-containing protein
MESGKTNLSEPLQTAAFSITRWRESFIRLVLIGATVIGLVTAVVSDLDMINKGNYFLAYVYSAIWLLVLIITVRRWPYWLRSGTFLFVFYALGVSGLLENGMRGDARLFFLGFVIMAALLISPRFGIKSMGLTLLTIGVMGWLVFSGHYILMSKDTVPGPVELWIVSSLDLILLDIIVLTAITLFLREFDLSQKRVGQIMNDLSREHTLLRTLIDNLPDSIYVKDLQGRKIMTNRADLEFLGFESEDQVLGKTDREILLEKFTPELHANDLTVIQSGQPLINQEEFLTGVNQQARWLLTSKIPLKDEEGKITGLVGIGRDITARKQSEEEIRRLNAELEQRVLERTRQLEEANHDLESYSYSVSHDLRAPLRAIDGFVKVLWEEYSLSMDSVALKYLVRIRDNSAKMGKLIDDLLKFSRVGQEQVNKEMVDLPSLIHEVYDELYEECGSTRNINLSIDELPQVEGDKVLLRQVFTNLLSNAIKYTSKGDQAEIGVGTIRQNGEIVFFIHDNGVGFDMTYADKLFGVFQRLHRESEFEGTGVGLAIVKRIIEKHGGRIWAESEVDKGSTFYFTIN